MLKVGLFLGSFNPIHIGHLALANYIAEFTELDEIWFVISPLNPLKSENELASEKERLEMVNISIKNYSRFKSCDIEFSLPKPSYTIHTLQHLTNQYPFQFSLIMGSDNLAFIDQWKDAQLILNNYEIIVYPRKDFSLTNHLHKNIKLLTQAPMLEISSTFIRQSINKQKDIQFFLHPTVNEYIQKHKVYPIKK